MSSDDEVELADIKQTIELLRERLASTEAELLEEENAERRAHLSVVPEDDDA